MNKEQNLKSAQHMVHNVEYKLVDKFGNVKQVFQDNRLSRYLLNAGIISPLWRDTWLKHFSFLLGGMSDSRLISNLVVSAGKAGIASRINGAGSEAAFLSIGIGTGTGAAAAGDTALGTEVKADGTGASGVHAIASATATRVTTSVTNDTAQDVGTINFTATIAVTEAGLFNATTNGTMLARQVFTAINVVTGDSLQITWKVQVS